MVFIINVSKLKIAMSSSHMNNYQEFIENNFIFPQDEFEVDNNQLVFNDVPIMELIKNMAHRLNLLICLR